MAGVILVFGGNGQVGWELQRSLAVLGAVVALDRAAVDLASPAAISALIAAQRPRAIINAAAYTAVDRAEQERELAFAINATAPAAMAAAAAMAGIPFIHYSSDYVYAGNKPGVYVETDATEPLSAYGRSKLAGDEAVLAAGGQAVILRTSWVYAARGANFMKTMLRLADERDRGGSGKSSLASIYRLPDRHRILRQELLRFRARLAVLSMIVPINLGRHGRFL